MQGCTIATEMSRCFRRHIQKLRSDSLVWATIVHRARRVSFQDALKQDEGCYDIKMRPKWPEEPDMGSRCLIKGLIYLEANIRREAKELGDFR